MDAEACFLKTHKFEKNTRQEYYNPRRDWLELRKKIHGHKKMASYMNLEEGKIEDLNTYYAIVRCDGDNLGRIIQGKIGEGFRITVKEYFCNMLEGPAREVVEAIANNDYENAKKICEEHNVKEISGKISEISKFINELQYKGEILISPSYHSALSRALIANAVRDARIIDKHDGLTIYAGGDDLLALTPVKNSIPAVKELREKFSFPSSDYKGFDNVSNYLIPSLVTASRSFTIYITHYMFPLYTAISRSAELLEGIAKKSTWIIDAEKRKKDTLILSYSPRGGELYSLLPLSYVKIQEQSIAKSLIYIDELVSLIEEGRDGFSSSLIYDLYNNFQTIESLIYRRSEALLKRLVRRIFERNCEIQDEQKLKEAAERWAQRLMEDYDISVRVDDRDLLFPEQFFFALKLYRSGLRGVE